MMNELEKSDPSIVAAKPTNKGYGNDSRQNGPFGLCDPILHYWK